MNKNMYALLDKQVGSYMNPIHFLNHGDAVRWLTTVVNPDKEQTNISLYPYQFTLFYLGQYDDQTGKFDHSDMQEIMEAQSVKQQIKQYTIDDIINAVKEQEASK